MGVSTNAILFYGIHHDSERDEPDGWTFETWLDEKSGFSTPYPGWRDRAAVEVWEQARKAAHRSVYGVDLDFDWHCCPNEMMPYISVARTLARRGYPEEISSLEVPAGADEALARVAADLGGEWSKPGWYLVAWWDG